MAEHEQGMWPQMSHPKHPCPDCGRLCDNRAERCIDCHLRRRRKPPSQCRDCGTILASGTAIRCRRCAGLARRAQRIHTGTGYVQIFRPERPLARADGYVFEHRGIVHDAGIQVPDGCHVHHRNGDKTDNRLENLEVISAADHTRRHIAEAGFVVTNQYGTFPVGHARWPR